VQGIPLTGVVFMNLATGVVKPEMDLADWQIGNVGIL
jgi:hypothetical protein